jgi:hypothetical protein
MFARAASLGVALSFLIAVVSGTQVKGLPSATAAHGGFGLSNQTGTHLLLTADLAAPELLKTALCAGRRFPVRFNRRQVEGKNDNGRQTPYNFDNLAGSVFTVLAGKVDPAATCFLASEQLLAGATSLNITAPAGSGVCLQRGRFATLRERQVIHCWPLAQAAPGKQLALLEFARRGKDALAAVVFVNGARTSFADYPAEVRGPGEDLWRVDDGGGLSPDGFEIVCVVQRGGWYALAIAWAGSEGRSLSLWVSDGSERFTEVLSDYWYHVPV